MKVERIVAVSHYPLVIVDAACRFVVAYPLARVATWRAQSDYLPGGPEALHDATANLTPSIFRNETQRSR